MNAHPRLFQAICENDGYNVALFVCFESVEDYSNEEIEQMITEEFQKADGDIDTAERCLESRINIERTYVAEVNVRG
jgi:hypothetical protein